MPPRWFEIRSGNTGLVNNSGLEVLGNGVGAENTVFLGGYNAVQLVIEWSRGTTSTAPTMRVHWSPEGRLFFQKCFVDETNAVTLSANAQVITFPSTMKFMYELPAHAPFMRIGITCNDPNLTTSSITIRALPRLR